MIDVMVDDRVFFHVYASSAVGKFSDSDLMSLLEASRENNARDGVTGMLLYKDGNFMQALEGPPEGVRAVLERVRRDPRHRGMLKLIEGFRDGRDFGDWSMAFANLNNEALATTPGYSEFMAKPLNDAEFVSQPSKVRTLLLSFRKVVR